MTHNEFIDAVIKKLAEMKKLGLFDRYERTAKRAGDADILLYSPENVKLAKLGLSHEVQLLTLGEYYSDEVKFTYSDADRPEVLSDLMDTISRYLEKSYFEEWYSRGSRVVGRNLYFTDKDGLAIGSALHGRSSLINKVLKSLPGTHKKRYVPVTK